jgi:hypothetical protein
MALLRILTRLREKKGIHPEKAPQNGELNP